MINLQQTFTAMLQDFRELQKEVESTRVEVRDAVNIGELNKANMEDIRDVISESKQGLTIIQGLQTLSIRQRYEMGFDIEEVWID